MFFGFCCGKSDPSPFTKKTHSPAALNISNNPSTGLFRQLRETRKLSFFHVLLQSGHTRPIDKGRIHVKNNKLLHRGPLLWKIIQPQIMLIMIQGFLVYQLIIWSIKYPNGKLTLKSLILSDEHSATLRCSVYNHREKLTVSSNWILLSFRILWSTFFKEHLKFYGPNVLFWKQSTDYLTCKIISCSRRLF